MSRQPLQEALIPEDSSSQFKTEFKKLGKIKALIICPPVWQIAH